MKEETRGSHHFMILSEYEVTDLLSTGIICTGFNPDGSFEYIILEEVWEKKVEKEINND